MERSVRLVDSPTELERMLTELRTAPLLAVDTESNAFHAYHPRVCLVQLGDGAREWVVDVRALDDVSPLGELLNGAATVKIVHAADGDILGLRRDFGFGIAPIFDTMLAARLVGHRRFGLSDLLTEYFGVSLDKRFQRHDWGERPIAAPALQYAAADVRFLPRLCATLRAKLIEQDRLAEAEEEFRRLERITRDEKPFDPEAYWRMKGARELDPPGRAVLRELYLWRDERARAQNRPPFRVVNDETLLAIARLRPTDGQSLRRAGLTPLQADRYGERVIEVVRRGQRQPPPALPRFDRTPPDPVFIARYDALRAWRRTRAEGRDIEPELIVSNAALRELALAMPTTVAEVTRLAELGPWKAAHYAAEMVEVLRQTG